jgi:hypothetical protein
VRWPWVTRARLHREVASAARAYREERDDALRAAQQAQAASVNALQRLTTARLNRTFDGGRTRLRITIDVDDLFCRARPQGNELELVARRIVSELAGLERDYRGDLRETPGQRMLRL